MDFDVIDLDRTKRTFAIRGHARDFLHQFDGSVIALSKDGVAAIEARVRNFGDEELRAVGVGSGVGVGETPGTVEGDGGGSFIFEFVAGIARAIAGRISALDHEFGNYTMEDGAVIKRDAMLLDLTDGTGPVPGAVREADEIGDSDWRYLGKERAMQIASGGMDDRDRF